ncbi:7-carboxy-7-deazaguanine synthase QueE [Alkaliflexus imshenetskii]|uniref:7-carboxy-7-deazaguanine synthase QueE n=1 Tax=Alkaliflexus imshenetskii TaxID=286730 RepID=UPI0004BA878A|nr:7-carboxy-7-deazaguanine synthase QueE [Alkaliflexus imshenetskii]
MSDKLILANEGVFPVVKDKNGDDLKDMPATGMNFAGTIQGEGKLAGVPSLFIRLSSCNLRCIWQLPDGSYSRCDTPYASFDAKGVNQMDVNEITDIVRHNLGPIRHVVLTGGEPLLQKAPLAALASRLKGQVNLHLTMETNGTLYDEELAAHIDLFSISPKLLNSVPNEAKLAALGLKPSGPLSFHGEKRLNLSALQSYIDLCRNTTKELQMKFVVGRPEDEAEIKNNYLKHLHNWKPDEIMLMPLGANSLELQQTTPMVLEMAIRNGWRFTQRVHIDLFGAKAGV